MDDISSVSVSVCMCVYVSMCVGVKKNDLEKIMMKKETIYLSYFRHSGRKD